MHNTDFGLLEVHRSDGRWLVDGDLLMSTLWRANFSNRLLANWRTSPLPEYKKKESVLDSASSALFEWFTPTVKIVDIDMERVKSEARALTEKQFYSLLQSSHSPLAIAKNDILQLVKEGIRSKELYRGKSRNLNKTNNQEINNAVSKYDLAISGAQVVRDTSIDVVIVGATVATGGTGGALLAVSGGAGVLKGAATYQDTGNVGAAVVSGTVGAMTTMIKIPVDKMPAGSSKVASEGVLVFIEAVGDVSADLVAGKSAEEALVGATVKKLSGMGMSKGLDKLKISNYLEKVVETKGFRTPIPASTALSSVAHELTKGGVSKATTGGATSLVETKKKVAAVNQRVQQGGVIATIDNSAELRVNYMFQKIG